MRDFVIALGLVAIASLVLAGALDATYLVLEAHGDASVRYPSGTVLPAGVALEFSEDASLVLLSDTGDIVTVTGATKRLGPQASATAGSSAALRAVAEILAPPNAGRPALGAARGGSSGAPRDPWVVDITSAGRKCVFPDRPTILWRPKETPAGRVSLQALEGDQTRFFDWPAGLDRVPWPPTVDQRSGGTYLFSMNTGSARSFELVVGPKAYSSGRALLFFAESGCREQAETLLEELRRAGTTE